MLAICAPRSPRYVHRSASTPLRSRHSTRAVRIATRSGSAKAISPMPTGWCSPMSISCSLAGFPSSRSGARLGQAGGLPQSADRGSGPHLCRGGPIPSQDVQQCFLATAARLGWIRQPARKLQWWPVRCRYDAAAGTRRALDDWARWLLDRLPLLDRWRLPSTMSPSAWPESGRRRTCSRTPGIFGPSRPARRGRAHRPASPWPTRCAHAPAASGGTAGPARDRAGQPRHRAVPASTFRQPQLLEPSLCAPSGVGQRVGFARRCAAVEEDLLTGLLPAQGGLSVLDWGCGDLEVVRGFPWRDYVGVDISTEALRMAKEKRPDWSFATPAAFDADDGQSATSSCASTC